MRGFPHELYVAPGDEIRASHVRALGQMVEERTYLAGYNVRRRETPYGTVFEAVEQVTTWRHPWEARLLGPAAQVSAGLLNADVPWLADRAGFRRLDGMTADNEPHPQGAPVLELKPTIFTPEGHSWIVLRVFVDEETGARLSPAEGGLTLAQTDQATWENGGSVDQVAEDGWHYGDYPLALLRRPRRDTQSLGVLTQHAMFHLNHRFVASSQAGQAGTHFFYV